MNEKHIVGKTFEDLTNDEAAAIVGEGSNWDEWIKEVHKMSIFEGLPIVRLA